jgi:peptidoglycan/xylan/chitin deacetylase (PgdA/CDA1 family)
MRVPGLKRLRLAARWVKSRFTNSALILGYHRITQTSRDPYSICVSPEHFAQQLETLRKRAAPISLREVVEGLECGELPPRAVALTFDDGYKDHLYEVKPLLEKYEVPATFFVTTGYFDTDFWWNELEDIIISPAKLPPRLSISINGGTFGWNGGSIEHSMKNSSSRHNLLLSVHHRMLLLPQQERQRLLTELREWANTDSSETRSKALTRDEVVQLGFGDLVDIGAHSVTHPFLNALSTASQEAEIQQSKASLETLLGRPISGFSYPNGAASEQTISIVQDAGFLFACASYNDVAGRGSNRFYLPRFWIGDWDGQTFSWWLQRWLCSPREGGRPKYHA